MNIAFLFSADDPACGALYGASVMKRILGTRVLQGATRNMRVSIGDMLIDRDAHTISKKSGCSVFDVYSRVYSPARFNRLLSKKLMLTFGRANVCCWLIQNMTQTIGEALHAKLAHASEYLGAMDVDYSNPFHLAYFRNSLIEAYRVHGTHCSIFYSMGENEDPDVSVKRSFEKYGFKVSYEDMGARRTIFDNFYDVEHFERIKAFQEVIGSIDGLNENKISDIVVTMEELHPKLFEPIAAAARAFKQASTEDDFAQAAFSGRRFMEKLADYLYPPSVELVNGRKVGNAEYKNRIWAYIDEAIPVETPERNKVLLKHGKEADRLINLLNIGLHHEPTKEKVMSVLRDLIVWLSAIIEINPARIRKPYLAYSENIRSLLLSVKRSRKGLCD